MSLAAICLIVLADEKEWLHIKACDFPDLPSITGHHKIIVKIYLLSKCFIHNNRNVEFYVLSKFEHHRGTFQHGC